MTKPREGERQATPAEIAAASDPDAFLAVHVVAALAGVSAWTVHEWVKAGVFPRPLWLGAQTKRWRAGDVRAWLQARAAQAASSSGAGSFAATGAPSAGASFSSESR